MIGGSRLLVGALMAALFVDALLYGLATPTLPARLGGDPAEVGLVFAAYGLGQLLACPAAGPVVDRWGPRAVLLGAMPILAAASAVYGWVDGAWGIAAARFLQGAAAAASWTAALSALATLGPVQSRGATLGTAGLATAAGLLLGPPIGGELSARLGPAPPFILAGALALAVALPLRALPAERPPALRVPYRALLRSPAARAALMITLLESTLIGAVEPTTPIELSERLGASPAAVGWGFALTTAAWGLGSPFAGALGDKAGPRAPFGLGLLLCAGAVTILGAAASPTIAMSSLGLLGLGLAGLYAAANPLLASASASLAGGTGSAYAASTLIFALGSALGPALGGLAAERLGFGGATALGAILLLCVGLPYCLTLPPSTDGPQPPRSTP